MGLIPTNTNMSTISSTKSKLAVWGYIHIFESLSSIIIPNGITLLIIDYFLQFATFNSNNINVFNEQLKIDDKVSVYVNKQCKKYNHIFLNESFNKGIIKVSFRIDKAIYSSIEIAIIAQNDINIESSHIGLNSKYQSYTLNCGDKLFHRLTFFKSDF